MYFYSFKIITKSLENIKSFIILLGHYALHNFFYKQYRDILVIKKNNEKNYTDKDGRCLSIFHSALRQDSVLLLLVF